MCHDLLNLLTSAIWLKNCSIQTGNEDSGETRSFVAGMWLALSAAAFAQEALTNDSIERHIPFVWWS